MWPDFAAALAATLLVPPRVERFGSQNGDTVAWCGFGRLKTVGGEVVQLVCMQLVCMSASVCSKPVREESYGQANKESCMLAEVKAISELVQYRILVRRG